MGGGDMADDGVGEEAKVNIRSANGSKFYVHANLNSTVVNFKSIVAQKCDIPAQQQRLIHKGRIMKDDQTLRSYGLEGDHTVYLLRGFATAAPADSTATTDAGIQNTNSTSTNAGSNVGRRRGRPPFGPSFFPELDPDGPGLGAVLEIEQMQQQLVHNPDMVRDILNIPAVHDLVDNPEIVRNMIINNPQMRDVMDHNPELAHIINDPATLRQAMDSARNPEILREIMRNTDRAMSNIESSPEGFNALRRMYEDLQQPLLNATTLTEDDSSDLESDPFATLFGAQAGRTGTDSSFITPGPENTTNSPAPNTNPLPNPWAFAGTGRRHRDSGALGNPIGNTMADSPGGHFLDLELMEDSVPDLTVSNEANELMQDPVISQTIRNMLSNPQYLNQMLGFNPQLQNVLDSNPQIRDVMQNPEFIRRLATPQIVHELLIYHRGLVSQASEEEARNDGGTGNATAARGLEVLMDMFGGLATRAGITPASRPQGPPEEQYATELSQLQEMGFFNTQENIRALVATAGNVHAAVERLLGI